MKQDNIAKKSIAKRVKNSLKGKEDGRLQPPWGGKIKLKKEFGEV